MYLEMMFPIKCKFIGYLMGFPIVMFDYQRVYPNLSNISNDCWFTSPSCWSKVGFPNPTLLSDPARVLIPRSTVNWMAINTKRFWASTKINKNMANMDSDTEEKEHSRKFWRSKESQNSHHHCNIAHHCGGPRRHGAVFRRAWHSWCFWSPGGWESPKI